MQRPPRAVAVKAGQQAIADAARSGLDGHEHGGRLANKAGVKPLVVRPRRMSPGELSISYGSSRGSQVSPLDEGDWSATITPTTYTTLTNLIAISCARRLFLLHPRITR